MFSVMSCAHRHRETLRSLWLLILLVGSRLLIRSYAQQFLAEQLLCKRATFSKQTNFSSALLEVSVRRPIRLFAFAFYYRSFKTAVWCCTLLPAPLSRCANARLHNTHISAIRGVRIIRQIGLLISPVLSTILWTAAWELRWWASAVVCLFHKS